jgi:hypothetical protein
MNKIVREQRRKEIEEFQRVKNRRIRRPILRPGKQTE